jgi:hypothetical protein
VLAADVRPSMYEVLPGDTLSGIASWYRMELKELESLNSSISPNQIAPGQLLHLKHRDTKVQVSERSRRAWLPARKVPSWTFIGGILFVVMAVVLLAPKLWEWIFRASRRASAAMIPLFQSPRMLLTD